MAERVGGALALPGRSRPVRMPGPSERPLLVGTAVTYLGLMILLPIAAVAWTATGDGLDAFWRDVSAPQTVAAIRLTVLLSLAVVAVNAVVGTALAWVLVRDDFRGRRLLDGCIDLPFALPTIVSGLVLLSLYGPSGPGGVDVAYSRAGILLALLFVTLPFVVRAVQPVLYEIDRESEEAARTLGARPAAVLRRIILPALTPAVLTGSGLAFSRALGEFGSVVLLAGNVPFRTEVASVHIFGLIESDDPGGAAAVSVVLIALALAAQALLVLLRRRLTRHAGATA
jgi:sulfate transport system permease protein